MRLWVARFHIFLVQARMEQFFEDLQLFLLGQCLRPDSFRMLWLAFTEFVYDTLVKQARRQGLVDARMVVAFGTVMNARLRALFIPKLAPHGEARAA